MICRCIYTVILFVSLCLASCQHKGQSITVFESEGINGVDASLPDILENQEQIMLAKGSNAESEMQKVYDSVTARRYFSKDKSDTLSVKGARLYVSANSMSRNRTLSITPLTERQVPDLPSAMVNVTGGASGFRFLPHGEHFIRQAATVVLPYDSTLIPPGYTADDIHTYYFDEIRKEWVVLKKDTIETGQKLVYASTTHFTDMINGIIQVPESPETQGYVPTSISEMKAADPATGVIAIEPPTAKQSGEASIYYPIDIPVGRKGMQPYLSLQYNSDAGSGWVGYGWSLSLPSVTIDTRWGVPLFDSQNETESYLVMGEQLTEQVHKKLNTPRESEKLFYLRVEGSFTTIIRHGNDPKNYWWETVDKSGTRNQFGAKDNKVHEESVVRNEDGNIVYWALVETRNVFKDFVEYSYIRKDGNLYPSQIVYTGHDNEPGAYKVEFALDDKGEIKRKDKSSSGRLGLLQLDNQLLKEIRVCYNSELLRSIQLQYFEGVFGKTMLESVLQKDSEGKVFNKHEFEYYNDIENGIYGEPEIWNTGSDIGLESTFGKDAFTSEMSAISGVHSSGISGGGGVMVGVGIGMANVSGGVSLTYSKNKSEGSVTLIDIDGDGLPDKVFASNGKIYYRPNLSNEKTGNVEFGQAYELSGINKFSQSESSSSSRSINLGIGLKAGLGSSFDKTKSTEKTTVYFYDFNGDGLPDIAQNGTVYFNHIDTNGHPRFTPTSSLSPNPILGTDVSLIDRGFIPDYNAERDSLERDHPLHDVVRVWRAPYRGNIKVAANISLTTPMADWLNYEGSPDGVIATIQKQSKVLWRGELTSPEEVLNSKLNTTVEPGELLLFRLQSKYSGAMDEVIWSPSIEYSYISSGEIDTLDENSINRFYYNSEDDFIFTGKPDMVINSMGNVDINMSVSKEILEDDVCLVITKHSAVEGSPKQIYRKKLGASERIINQTEKISLQVADNDTVNLSFGIESKTQVDWRKIHWKPIVETLSDGNKTWIAPQMSMFNKDVFLSKGQQIKTAEIIQNDVDTTFFDSIYVVPYLIIDQFEEKDSIFTKINFSMRDSLSWFFSKELAMNGKELVFDTVAIDAGYENRTIRASFYASEELKAVKKAGIHLLRKKTVLKTKQLKNPSDTSKIMIIEYIDTVFVSCHDIEASVHSVFNRLDVGHLHRGWGQFGWDGNGLNKDKPIPVEALKYSAEKYKKLKGSIPTDSPHVIEEIIGEEPLFSLSFIPEKNIYGTLSENAFIGPWQQSSSRVGVLEIVVDSVSFPTDGTGLAAPNQKSRSVSQSSSVNASIGHAGGSYSESNMESTSQVLALDLNGDRYPDWVKESDGKVLAQYTSPLGNLSSLAKQHTFDMTKTQGKAQTISGSLSVKSSGGLKAFAQAIKDFKLSGNTGKTGASMKEVSENASVDGNYSSNSDSKVSEWIDMNGDGLPDMVFDDGTVRFNLGYQFTAPTPFGHTAIMKNTSRTTGGGGGVVIPVNGYLQTSYGNSFSFNTTCNNFRLADINGDGLPDMVSEKNVAFNTGAGFSDFISLRHEVSSISKSTSLANNGSFGFTVIFTAILPISVSPSIVLSHSQGVSRTLKDVMDINGDGYPDIIESDVNNVLSVRLNQMGRTNLLKNIHRPFGATISLDYATVGNTYDMPQSKIVLSRVDVQNNMPENGATRMSSTYAYYEGYYDRQERNFYGFGKVLAQQLDTENDDQPYRSVLQEYDNRNYYTKNLLKSSVVADREGNALTRSSHSYKLKPRKQDIRSCFPALSHTVTEQYEGVDGEALASSESFEYDGRGNVIFYLSNAQGEVLASTIDYHTLADNHIFNVPKSITVTSEGKQMRHRETDIDEQGNVTQIRLYNSTDVLKYDMSYDRYGNLKRVTRPHNHKGDRMWYEYTYDDVLNMLVVSVSDALGYTSSARYDYRWAAPIETIDINGNRMLYCYDKHGRMLSVRAPYEQDSGSPYTISFEYHPDAPVPYARTAHYDSHTGSDIETYTFSDALMRPVQVKKRGVIDDNGTEKQVMIVSGRAKYDAMGRVIAAYQPLAEPVALAATYSSATDAVSPVVTRYDHRDRVVETILPDGALSTNSYLLEQNMGQLMLKTISTDPLGRKADTYTDARGRTRTTKQHIGNSQVRVDYIYNPLGELMEVIHPDGNKTSYTYDRLGRQLSVDHPDAGLTTLSYDPAGNLVRRQTANLRNDIGDGAYICYEYDHERLHEILYPKNIFNRVTYSYGKPGESHNRAGRLTLVEDGSGGEAYYYGKMGEVIKTVKTVVLSLSDIRTYVWGASYDSWNRIRNMSYPDGEKVEYHYNLAGNLRSITSLKDGREQVIIEHQGYDKLEHTTRLKTGNGAVTCYSYDPLRLRLQTMSVTAQGGTLMNNSYAYDAVDNILSLSNSATPSHGPGRSYSHTYQYDELNRLVSAEGTSGNALYTLRMSYDLMGNILRKKQDVDNSTVASSHDLCYLYQSSKPNAASMIGSKIYTYDHNGNPLMRQDTISGSTRQMVWDEENRLSMLSDDSYASRYTYNHSGERVLKSHGGTTGIYIDGNPQGILYHDADNYTVYVSPYMVVGKDRFTKHYYAGTRRVASKLGAGQFNNLYRRGSGSITAGQKDYSLRLQTIERSRSEHYAALGIPPGPPTSKGIFGEPEHSGTALPNVGLGNYDIPAGWPQPPVKNAPGDVPGPPVMYGPATNPDDTAPGYGYANPLALREDDIFFYHTDHLGSTAYITDSEGSPTQFVCYMPFGAAFVDEHSTRPEMPYKFNGKEQDAETGLYYYGARYYEPDEARWYGVDPMAGLASGWSPYRAFYCSPIRYIDPTGMLEDDYGLDKFGNITLLRETDDKTDKLIALDDKGAEIDKSIEVEKGILNKVKEGKDSQGNKYEYMKIDNDKIANSLFEFVAETTTVEWSQVKYGSNSNYVSTSHEKKIEYGGVDLMYNLLIGGTKVREHIHSHPDRKTNYHGPSGFHPKDRNSGDRELGEWVNKYYTNKGIKLKVYEVPIKKYIEYNHKGIVK